MLNTRKRVPGEIILIPFPFTDLSSSKIRPALVLSCQKNDVVIACISSQKSPLPSVTVVPSIENGLKTKSFVLPSKIATLDHGIITGSLGFLEKSHIQEVKKILKEAFGI